MPKFDISKAPHPHVIDLLAPILPGGLFCIGMGLYRPTIGAFVNQHLELNYAAKVALFIFISYICGAVLLVLTTAILGTITIVPGAVVGSIVGTSMAKSSSRSRVWRIAALQFLGSGFVEELRTAPEEEEVRSRLLECVSKAATTEEAVIPSRG